MSGLSKGSVDRSLIVPPEFSGRISSAFDQDENNCDLRDVGLIRAVTTVKKLPVAGSATPGLSQRSYIHI